MFRQFPVFSVTKLKKSNIFHLLTLDLKKMSNLNMGYVSLWSSCITSITPPNISFIDQSKYQFIQSLNHPTARARAEEHAHPQNFCFQELYIL
jgi:hypothetical protein